MPIQNCPLRIKLIFVLNNYLYANDLVFQTTIFWNSMMIAYGLTVTGKFHHAYNKVTVLIKIRVGNFLSVKATLALYTFQKGHNKKICKFYGISLLQLLFAANFTVVSTRHVVKIVIYVLLV